MSQSEPDAKRIDLLDVTFIFYTNKHNFKNINKYFVLK